MNARRHCRPDRRYASQLIDLTIGTVLDGPLSEDGYHLWDAAVGQIETAPLRCLAWFRHRRLSQPRHHRAWQVACRLAARLGLPRPRQFGRVLVRAASAATQDVTV